MSWVTVIWSLAAGACLTLGITHLLIWRRISARRANFAFAAAAISTAGIAFCELSLMTSSDPKDYQTIQRWAHLPVAIMLVSLASFVRHYFQTTRPWLFWLAVTARMTTLVVNFLQSGNINFSEVQTLDQIPFLGQQVSVVSEAVTNPWNRLAETSTLLFLALYSDASIRLWRKGDADSRRRAGWIGGAIVLFIVLAASHGFMINEQVAEAPFVITLCFMGIIWSMAHQLGHDVSEAGQLADELRVSQENLTMAGAAAQLALWNWDVRRNEIWVTHEGRSMYGVPSEGKITIECFLETLHPEDRQGVKDALNEALSGGGDFQRDYRILHADGRTRWISVRAKVEFGMDGSPQRMRGVSMDNTGRNQAEERASLLVEAAPYSMIMVDQSARIVQVNRQAEDTFGYSREELQGQLIEMLVPERYRPGHGAMHHSFMRAPSSRPMGEGRELAGRRRDGTEFPVEVGLCPVETSEGRFVLASVSDVSERKRMEAEVHDQREALAHLSRVTSLGLLSGSLAHEINQPLGIILANAQAAQRMLQQGNLDLPELREILDDIVGEDLRAGEAIKRLRSLLKRGQSNPVPLNLNDVIQDVLRLTQGDVMRRQVVVCTDLAPVLAAVRGDSVQLQQVLLNLILNACEAMENSPVGRRSLHVSSRMTGEAVRISVRDQGCGLPAGGEFRIFQPFFTTKEHGLGIGLSISQSIMKAHHARFWAEANPEGGTTFHLEFQPSPAASA